MGASMGNAGEVSSLLLTMLMKKMGCCLPCTCLPRGNPGEVAVSKLFCEFPICETQRRDSGSVSLWETLELPSWQWPTLPPSGLPAVSATGQPWVVPRGAKVELQGSKDTPGSLHAHQVFLYLGNCAPAVTRDF